MDSERIWRIVENHRGGVPARKRKGPVATLSEQLHDLYVEALQTNNDKNADKRFRCAVNLLSRVDKSFARPSLIVNLYEDEKGYSIVLCTKEGGESDEIFLPYEDNEIFSYLDNQEIPPVLMEILEQSKYCHLYNGSVVCEVRNYRSHSVLTGYDKHLLLLKPTAETLIATVNELAHQTNANPEEKLYIEACLLLATAPPLCLETSTDVLCVSNRLDYNQRKFHTHGLRRYLKKRCHAARALMHLPDDGEAPDGLELNEVITNKNTRSRNVSNSWKKQKLSLDVSGINMDSLAKEIAQLAKPVVSSREEITMDVAEPADEGPQPSTTTNMATIAEDLLHVQNKQNGVPERGSIIQQPIAHPQPTTPILPTPPKVVSPPANQNRPPDHVTIPRTAPAIRPIQTPKPPAKKFFPLVPPKLKLLASAQSVQSNVTAGTSPSPPKLHPLSRRVSPIAKATPIGMPRLHPLSTNSPNQVSPKSPPTMPTLHKLSTPPRLSMPTTQQNVSPQTSVTATPPIAQPSPTHTQSPLVVRTLPQQVKEASTQIADTRMPTSLSGLGLGEPQTKVKHSQSRSGKFISGTKVKAKKKKVKPPQGKK